MNSRRRKATAPPFAFVLELLDGLLMFTRPMFGCTAIYVGPRIVFVLRERPKHPASNGVWIATTKEHHASLRAEFPGLKNIPVLGPGVTGWQMLPSSDQDFDESVEKLCACVRKGDPRIGKIPTKKKKGRGRT